MSGLEVLAVVGAVAAVVSAFNDGNSLVNKIKERRRAKRVPLPPQPLEESLELGPTIVIAEANNGIRDFGRAFEMGDGMLDRYH